MKIWDIIDGQLTKEFTFKDFREAIVFVNAVAEVAEDQNHHPDILVHAYKKVKISLYTHSENAITQKDHQLAEAIDTALEVIK